MESEYIIYIKNKYPEYWGILRDYRDINNKGLLTLCIYIKHILTLINDNNINIPSSQMESEYLKFHNNIEEKMCEFNRRINLLNVASLFKARYNSDYFTHVNDVENKKVIIDLSMYNSGYWYEFYYFYIYLPVPDPSWFKGLVYKMLPKVASNINTHDNEEVLLSTSLIEQKYKLLCQIFQIPYKKRTLNEKKQIIFDFNKIGIYEKPERISLYKSFSKALKSDKYVRFVNYREDQYYARVIKKLKNTFIEGKFHYKPYIMKDVPSKQHNSYYVDFQSPENVHPDLYIGSYTLRQYLKDNRLFRTLAEWKLLQKVLFSKYPFKLVLIRNVIKDTLEDDVMYMKTKGYIALYNLEIFLGYRCDTPDKQDIIDQMIKNYDQKNHHNGVLQKEFFEKHFSEAFKAYFNGVSYESVVQKKRKNELIFGDFQNTYGAAGSSTVHQETDKGKRIMSKTQFFAQLNNTNTEEIEKTYKKEPNYIIIKKETVKQRVVVNASLSTYPSLARIAKVISESYTGVSTNYNLMTKDQKAEMYGRFCKYTIHNTYINEDFLFLPLDYSSFDTTITKELILTTLRHFCAQTPYDVNRDINYFEYMLKRTKIKQREYDIVRNYRYGVLSGWKITNSVESLLNYVISYGITKELGLDLKDIITMGDDLVLVIKKPNLDNSEQKELLHSISEKYASLGFKVHNTKNMIGYRMIEFLRNTYYNNVVLPYPIRAITSLVFRQPTSGVDFVNYSSYLSNIQKYILRTGSYSQELSIIKRFFKQSVNKNIAELGMKLYLKPCKYRIKNISFYDYITKFEDIEGTVLYKFLLKVFNGEFGGYIKHYIKYNILSSKLTKEKIEKVKNEEQNTRDNKLLNMYTKKFFSNMKVYSRVMNLELETYNFYINEILLQILEREKYKFDNMKSYVMEVITNYYSTIGRRRFQNNFIFSLVTSKNQLKDVVRDYRLRADYQYYNNIIANRIKQKLYRFLTFSFLTKNHRFIGKDKQSVLQRKSLGYSLFDYSVGVLYNQGYYNNIFINVD